MMVLLKMSFQARHTKLLKFMIGSMKSEIPKFPEFSLKMQGPNFSLEKILQTNVIDENIKKTYEVDDTIFVKTVKN